MGSGNYCHRGSEFASSVRELTLTGLGLQEDMISMNHDNFKDAICENAPRIVKAKKWSEIDWKTAYEHVNRLRR